MPAGYRLDTRNGGSFTTSAGAKPGAVAERLGADGGVGPTRATMVATAPAGTDFELPAPFPAGELTFAAGRLSTWTTPAGPAYRGTTASVVELGALTVPAGSQVTWCPGAGLQVATRLGSGLKLGPYKVGQVRVVRSGTPTVSATGEACDTGEVRAFELVVAVDECVCGGPGPQPPVTARVDVHGQPLDVRSERALSRGPRTTPCPPCRGYRP